MNNTLNYKTQGIKRNAHESKFITSSTHNTNIIPYCAGNKHNNDDDIKKNNY